jgi:glycogen operon protein
MTVASPGQRVWPGQWQPLGATPDAAGTNFAIYSRHAQAITLCLFDDAGRETRVPLTQSTHHVWHAYIPGVGAGTRYGYRVDGMFDPAHGSRFNPNKLLIDPYALALDGDLVFDDAVFGFPQGTSHLSRDDRDSAAFVPKSVVVHDDFDWSGDTAPAISWADTIIYELHVRGFTKQHPEVPPELRGTFAGLAHPAAIAHLVGLGVTTVELLPVQHFVSEPALVRRGLSNYWGYNTLGFFAPHAGYSSTGSPGGQVSEFKAMVKALHTGGLEVIVDVVYNHTAEGDEVGPTLAFRGLDNQAYYRLADAGLYVNDTGTGNTFDANDPAGLQLITDSLRYWVTHMRVDGFRFDLATTLARTSSGVDMASALLAAIAQDPVLSRVKLIAEPWDIGPDGYQVGRFPSVFTEWNDRFRDGLRAFWMQGGTGVRDLGYRLSGSSDLYNHDDRRPSASLNFVACHDGFTLHDLVTYVGKHNEANGENNRDGSGTNDNWNFGVEGETDDHVVTQFRARAVRGLLGALLLSAGVPMLGHGDEIGRTQRGNNNAYCQDNELTWIDWSTANTELLSFTRALIALRRAHPVFRQNAFFTGRPARGDDVKDIAWFAPTGVQMTDADWYDTGRRTIAMYLSGRDIRDLTPRGEPVSDDSFLVVMHAGLEPTTFTLPAEAWAQSYQLVIDSTATLPSAPVTAGGSIDVPALAFLVLRVG